MKTEDEIRAKLKDIATDDRYTAPHASMAINAPLAMMQLSLISAAEAIAWVLGEEAPKPHGRKW